MGLRRPEFRLTSGVRRVGGRQTVGDGHTILTIFANDGFEAVVTTAAPHGLADQATVTLSGTVGFNGPWTIDLTGPTTFGLQGTLGPVSVTGGRWD